MAAISLINKVKYSKTLYFLYFHIGNFIIRVLRFFLKKDKELIVFSSFGGRRFDDSPKVIYDLMIKDRRFSEYKLVWAFIDPSKFQLPVGKKMRVDTFEYFKTLLKARVWITNTTMNRGLDIKGIYTFSFNTWHGTPIKKIGFDVDMGKHTFVTRSKSKISDILLAQGEHDKKIFSRCFGLPRENVKIIGLPRNDELVPEKTKSRRLELRHKFAIPSEKKVILYAPTFREYEKEGANCVLSLPVDFTKWQKKLGNEYVLLLRAHHEVVKLMNVSENEFLKNVSNYPNLNELMIVSDILISDYSSILFDYSIQAKPMFCFAYDYDQYEKERGFYFDIRKELSNEGLDNEERLLEALLNMNIQERIKITENFRDKYIQAYGDAGEKSLDIIYSSIHDDN